MNHTNANTASAAATIANDGILAGRELESPDDLLDLYEDVLSRKDKIAFGWIDPEATALELARRTGRIGGHYVAPDIPASLKLSPDQYDELQERIAKLLADPDGLPPLPNVESTVGVQTLSYRQLDILGWDDTFTKMPRRGQYDCEHLGRDKAKIVQSARGGSYRIDLACEDAEGDCPPCHQYWIDSAAARFMAGLIGDVQLVIKTTSCQTPEEGQKMITAIGRQLGAVRRAQVLSRTRDYTYDAHIVVTGAMPLPAAIERIKARPGVSAEFRPVSIDDFKALLHTRTKLDLARCPVRFLHWPKAVKANESATNEYAHNDGYVSDAMDARNILPLRFERGPSLKLPEKHRVRLREGRAVRNVDIWLTGIALDLVQLLKLRDARARGVRHKNDWKDCITAGTYDGPKALIRDLAAVLDDDGMVAFTGRRCMMTAATYIAEVAA